MRVGIGYDIHRLIPGRQLVLGGVPIEFDRGLYGQSDADVVLHAIIDALLGAAALGDIGGHFPPEDDRWRDADSSTLLRLVSLELAELGWRVENVDTNVIAEYPRLAPHIGAMRERIGGILGLKLDSVSVKAKTNERLGPVGEGSAIAAEAIVLIERRG